MPKQLRRAALLSVLAVVCVSAEDASCRAAIQKWREERETRLKSDSGWLTVVGLAWLKEGVNTIGSGPGNDVVLPPGSAPDRVGVFDLQKGKVSVRIEPGVNVTTAGNAVRSMELRPDTSGTPDVLAL